MAQKKYKDYRDYGDYGSRGRRSPYRIAIVLAIILFILVAPEMQDDSSMSPALKQGDAVCVVKKGYSEKRGYPDIGKVVVMEKAWSVQYAPDNIIGRVVALPGDKVYIKSKRLYVNGKEYILPGEPSDQLKDMKEIKIKQNNVFIVCDNLGEAADSSNPEVGPMPMKEIKGYALFKIWPLNHIGGIE